MGARLRLVIILLAVVSSASCSVRASHADAIGCMPPLTPHARHVLYFGLSSPLVPGRVITDDIWRTFAAEVLTQNFPAGMTVLDSYGEWRRGDGTHYGEPTKVVIHLASMENDSTAVMAVQAVIAEAKRRFGYRSVLWERSAACVAF